MSQKLFYICRFIVQNDDDYNVLLEHLGNHPVLIEREFPEELYFEIPTIYVGWQSVKNKFESQNIFDKTITNNLRWCFSLCEDEKKFYSEIDEFFSFSIKKWLPDSFVSYDCFLNQESISEFLKSKLMQDSEVFGYFHDGALYLNNNDKNFSINIKSLASEYSDFRNILTDVFNEYNIMCASFSNLNGYVNFDRLKNIKSFDTLRWVRYGVETLDEYFNIIPNFKVEKYIPFFLSKLKNIILADNEKEFYNRMCEKDKITCWLSSREIAFDPEYNTEKLDFKVRRNFKLAKVNYSSKRTITGRIHSKDFYNPQNLDKHNDDRTKIISRFEGGNILVFDYISFEPKIALYLSKDDFFIENYYFKDLHYEVGMMIFGIPDLEPEQRKFAKNIVTPLLYGAGDESLIKNLGTLFSNPEEQLRKVRNFLRPILKFKEELHVFYKEHGYVKTPWGTIIRPEKEFAYFNNYMQAYATEIVVDKLCEIKKLLQPYKTQFLFQVHDSLVFDLHPSESFLIKKISDNLSHHKNMLFSLMYSLGPNYKDVDSNFNIISE
jgi:hypothetical protein